MTAGQPPPAIFFLSDYGTGDEFVGVVHAVLHRLASGVTVIDLSHQVPPFDVAAGGSMLARSVPHLGSGVVLAVVDPGVGTGRRAVAVATAAMPPDRFGPTWLVGPDNGLLVPAADALGGAGRVIELRANGGAPTGRLGAGPTFDGRDVFAPAAAHLVLGGDPALLGPDVDPSTLVAAGSGRSQPDESASAWDGFDVVASVGWIDRFGNIQLTLAPGTLIESGLAPGGSARVIVQPGPGGGEPAARSVPVRWVRAFGELDDGELGLMTDANGSVALVLDRSSAADRLHISDPGAQVGITADPPLRTSGAPPPSADRFRE
jgi:S-adenosyl-L-methionine hydrolase (adenosine-forming)